MYTEFTRGETVLVRDWEHQEWIPAEFLFSGEFKDRVYHYVTIKDFGPITYRFIKKS